ncbi:gp53-like domain-containing protein [Asaia spathodeae]|uniref:Putative tail fiber protein gp53-like C-terminal domain-containing protein n=1 Tax=Asaia spathodeae TaxID=657016 RepID=A0ABX2P679_9PROT|nr:hypothetical protein [Asaia spathodeae]GBR19962.1 hypothetical protein AA105894_2442 [Asaia spathodeae NBRC 105894]
MDRKIIYPGQIPLVEDQLQDARFAQIAIGRLAGALYGEVGTGASGFACSPGTGMTVTVSPGEIIQAGVIDASAFGVLPASTSALPRQYILTDPVNITIPGAGATYIIYGTLSTADTANAVLPYFNSANPSQTFAGSGNGGANQPTVRSDYVTIGVASSLPSGSIPLWAVAVPSGATSVTAAMISAASGAPLYPSLRSLAARIVAPFNANLSAAFGGYPSKAIVADPNTTGAYWVSTADNNLTTPGASGAAWLSLFDAYYTKAQSDNRYLQPVALNPYYTSSQSDARYLQPSNLTPYYTGAQSDAKYCALTGFTTSGDFGASGVTSWSTTASKSSLGIVLTGLNGNTISLRQNEIVNSYTQAALQVNGYSGANGYFSFRNDGTFWSGGSQFATQAFATGTVAVSGNNWFWMKLPNGILIQGGNASYNSSDGTTGTTVTLPTTFGASFIYAGGNDIGSNANSVTVMRVNGSTIRLLGREVTSGTLQNTTINYLCIGTSA